jgi:hypothetical protein
MADTENPDYEGWNPEADSQSPIPVSDPHKQGVIRKSNSRHPEKKNEPTERRIREWAQVSINFILVVVGIVAICIYWGQLEVMKGQLGEIVRQYPEIHKQAEATQGQLTQAKMDSSASSAAIAKQIGAAERQAEAAQRSLDILRSQFMQEQRPYIVPEISSIRSATWMNQSIVTSTNPEPGKAVLVNISFQNVGKSNAIEFNGYRHVVFGDDGIDNSHADFILLHSKGVQPPGKVGSTTAFSLKNTYSRESAAIDPAELLPWNGQDAIYVFGAFTYFDRFGQYYCTPFRYLWLPDSKNWLNAEDFTETKTKKHHTADELCPKHGKQSGMR